MNKPRIDQGPDYERGFIDGMQHQMQSSVDKAINRMAQPEPPPECKTEAEKTAFAFGWWKALEANRAQPKQEPKCNPHPKAPHGFNRNASHANDRYTCECESWDAYEAGRLDGIAQEQAMYEVQRLGQEIQPEQEPVTFETWYENSIWGNEDFKAGCKRAWEEAIEHYAPPQRTWVGLTDEDVQAAWDEMKDYDDFDTYAEVIEAKLKEKNNG